MPIDPMSPGGVEFYVRAAEAVKMRRRGTTWTDIADKLDLGIGAMGVRAAKALVFRQMETMITPETKAETKALLLAEIDDLREILWRRIETSRGYDDQAISAITKLQSNQAKLAGLDVVRISVSADFDDIMKHLSAGVEDIPDPMAYLDAIEVDAEPLGPEGPRSID